MWEKLLLTSFGLYALIQIVYVSGAFDLFHIGHLSFLEKANVLGDYLIVGILSDHVSMFIKDLPGIEVRHIIFFTLFPDVDEFLLT